MPTGHCEIRLTRRYDASPSEVWAALTEPGSVARWLAPPSAFEFAPGGTIELDIGVHARVREVEPERSLELDWRYGDEDRSIVRFELTADGDGTLLTLDHQRIDARIGMTYITRWSGLLARFDREVARP